MTTEQERSDLYVHLLCDIEYNNSMILRNIVVGAIGILISSVFAITLVMLKEFEMYTLPIKSVFFALALIFVQGAASAAQSIRKHIQNNKINQVLIERNRNGNQSS